MRAAFAAHQQGRLAEAEAGYRRALSLAPQSPVAPTYLGHLLAEQGHLEQADALFRQALAVDPRNPIAHHGRGRFQKLQGDSAGAAESYRRAIAADPRQAAARVELGQLLVEMGRPEEAEAVLREALRLEPDLGAAYLQLGRLKRHRADDPEIAEMARRAGDPATPPDRALDLYFALGKAYDDLGHHDQAFEAFAKANRLKRKRIDFRVEALESEIDRTIAAFDDSLMSGLRAGDADSGRPIFIVGMPRSGTTLVEQILASHPEVYGGGESLDLGALLQPLQARAGSSAVYPECLPKLGGADWQALAGLYLERAGVASRPERLVTNKVPGNFRFLGLARLMLPNAIFIDCRRDPLDTCLSCYMTHFAAGWLFTYDLAELGRTYRAYERIMRHWDALLPGQVLAVPYESLVGDLEGWTRRLLEHCGLPWDPVCLAFDKLRRNVHTASAAQVRQPLYASSIGRWRPYAQHLEPLRRALGDVVEGA